MKTQTFAWSRPTSYQKGQAQPEKWRMYSSVRENYRRNRLNGDEEVDRPRRSFPFDGNCSGWCHAPLPGDKRGNFRICYDEGPKDREWVQEMDRNYLSRLARTGEWAEFDRLKCKRKTGLFGWGKARYWPEYLEEFATKLEVDYRPDSETVAFEAEESAKQQLLEDQYKLSELIATLEVERRHRRETARAEADHLSECLPASAPSPR